MTFTVTYESICKAQHIILCDSVRKEPERQIGIPVGGGGGRGFTQARDKSRSFLVWRPSVEFIIFPNLFSELFWECRHKRNQNLVNSFIRKIKFVKTLIGSLAVIESSDDIDGDYHYDNSFSSPNYGFFLL